MNDTALLLTAVGVGAALLYAGRDEIVRVINTEPTKALDMTEARGYRNNNPGNIKRNAINWVGMADPDSDGTFVIFESPFYGIRAAAKILATYERDYNIYNIAGLIKRWAPSNADGNETAEYIKYVSDETNIPPYQPISITALATPILRAMFHFENGYSKYTVAEISEGVEAAYA